MAALPYMQFYVADYLADTAHLNAAQHGAYLLLLMNYWQRGKALVNSNERLANVARMSNEEWEKNRSVLEEFFEISDGEWFHARVERDLEAVKSKSTQTRAAGKASANARAAKREQKSNERSTGGQRKGNHTDTYTEAEAEVDTETETTLALTPPGVRPAAPPPPVLTLPTNESGNDFPVTHGQVQEWRALYPAIDVMQQLRNMRGWLDGNRKNRKTLSGMTRFIHAWLAKEQNRSSPIKSAPEIVYFDPAKRLAGTALDPSYREASRAKH